MITASVMKGLTLLILKFSVSDFLSILVKRIKNLKFFLFLNCTDRGQMAVTKIFTFLYVKIFIVSVGLCVSYLILECLFVFKYDFL